MIFGIYLPAWFISFNIIISLRVETFSKTFARVSDSRVNIIIIIIIIKMKEERGKNWPNILRQESNLRPFTNRANAPPTELRTQGLSKRHVN